MTKHDKKDETNSLPEHFENEDSYDRDTGDEFEDDEYANEGRRSEDQRRTGQTG